MAGFALATYSFLDVQASIVGPNGAIGMGAGAANAEEGLSVEMIEDKGNLTLGADGVAMHSLHAGNAGRLRCRLLKTSPVNALLMAMYNLDRQSSLLWGRNQVNIANLIQGDIITCFSVAFARVPNLNYAKDGGFNEWEFLAGYIDDLLGTGIPLIAA